jgi:large subunit ribosomal protein L6
MSRIGRMPIKIPAGVTVNIDQSAITVTGPKGKLQRNVHPAMTIKQEDGILTVSRPDDSLEHRQLHGLTRTLVANMVDGVSQGFEKGLEIQGVGYRVEKVENKLVIRIGFSHTVDVIPMPGITLGIDGPTRIKVTGIDKEQVGEMAARIRGIHPPDSYKGKGIRYAGEAVHLKPGKVGKAIGGEK